MPVPESYYHFVMDYAPYLYVTPGVGPDLNWGKAAFAAGFAVDFLYEAFFDKQFDDRSQQIEDKIVELSDWLLTQQITNQNIQSYGGFASTENSNTCYSVDVGRTVPALLKAYDLTTDVNYLDSAKLAVSNFLFNMQQQPSAIGIHDRYYGGYARAVDNTNQWQPQMDTESLNSLTALKMLMAMDPAQKAKYETMTQDSANFYRPGIESASLYFDPKPLGDGAWHRVGLNDDVIYDDSIAYALLGLYETEGYSGTVQTTYEAINSINASPAFPAYNSEICWAGYINVERKTVACDYYDAVTSGILAKIRKNHDKLSYDFSVKILQTHADQFMFWGPKQDDYQPIENKQAMATVCWLGQLLVDYEPPLTRFTQVLKSNGENLTLYPITKETETTSFGKGVDIKAIVLPQKTDEVLIEPGYLISDYMALHVFSPIRRHDKIRRSGVDYEVTTIQDFRLRDQVAFKKAICRRLLS